MFGTTTPGRLRISLCSRHLLSLLKDFARPLFGTCATACLINHNIKDSDSFLYITPTRTESFSANKDPEMSDSSTAATQVVRYLALGTPLPGFCFFKVVKGCLGRSYALNRIQPVRLASCTHPIPRVAVSLPLVCTFGAYILVEAPSFSLCD